MLFHAKVVATFGFMTVYRDDMPVYLVRPWRQRLIQRNGELLLVLFVAPGGSRFDDLLLRIRHHHTAKSRFDAF